MSLQPRPYLGASVAVGARAGLGRERRKCERPTSDSRFIDDVKLASAGDRLSHGGPERAAARGGGSFSRTGAVAFPCTARAAGRFSGRRRFLKKSLAFE